MGFDSSLNHITHMHRESGGGSKRSSIRTYQLGPGSSREAFQCMFLCDACGYLCWTDPPCPACGKKAWIDLGFWNHAEALRSREEEERRHPPERLKWQVRMASLTAGGAIGLGSAAGLALAGVALAAPLVLTIGAGATLLTHVFGRRRIGWSIMTRRVNNPTRWHAPLPLAYPKAKPISQRVGPVHATGPLLRAPFSGRPCVAYDVGVVFDTPGDAWPPIWVLREMHSCAFEVQGKSIDAERVSLALPIKPVTEPTITAEQKTRFLRERGLFTADGQFDLFEAIVEPENTYELLWPSAPEGTPPILRAAPQGRAGDPYR
jgi:hypothetical protein